jgi:15-cis-phytoene synthase/lycopene beta-cyclase
VLALLWFGAGEYMLRRPLAVIISITLPTLFLCWVDTIAIAAGTWTISLRTSTGKMIVPHLPVEEFAFFTLINVILVFGTCAIDRAQAIIHLYKDNNPVENVRPIQQSFLQHIYGLIWAFFLPDQMLNNDTVQDLAVSWDILRKASKSFYTASAMFPGNIRQDLGVLYAFCRATDDFFDDETVPIKKRQHQLELMHQFIRDLFSQKTNASSAIDWEFYGNQLPASCLSAFKSFTRLRHVLKMDAIQELLDGYRWDLEHRPVITENDLRQYAACVASSVGEMCTRIILLHSDTEYSQAQVNWIIGRARDMGLVLQYTNIARDIVTDSQEAGRCYLPSVWLTETETLQIQKGNARGLDETRLLELSHKLIDEADRIMIIAKEGIAKLPNNCQGGVRAACYVYTTIGKTLKQCCSYPTRAHVKSARRAKIALLSVYHSKNKYF